MQSGQNCGAGKCGSENIGTVLQVVENAGVEFAGGLVLQDLNSRAFSTVYRHVYVCVDSVHLLSSILLFVH